MIQSNLPIVAIVGRSNVGKSTLFNKIAEQRQALVAKIAGTTRDRLEAAVSWQNRNFVVVDTGGLDLSKADPYREQVRSQSEQAVRRAAVILLLVDARVGFLPADQTILKKLRGLKKPILLGVNKCDTAFWRQQSNIFRRARLPLLAVSAANGSGVGDLLDAIAALLPNDSAAAERVELTLALVGKPNVGKSSLLNALCGEERMIVSPLPHTTRDAQAVLIKHSFVTPAQAEIHNKIFKIIDTAGIRRADRKAEPIEHLSIGKARQAMNQSDVIALVIDISREITGQDKRLAQEAIASNKGIMLVANKWDLIADKKPETIERHKKIIGRIFPHLSFAPIVFTSAVNGRGVKKILELAHAINQNRHRTVSAEELKKFLAKAVNKRQPTIGKGTRRPTILSLEQISAAPPHFLAAIPVKTRLAENYKQYLMNFLRDEFGLEGVPVKLSIKEKILS